MQNNILVTAISIYCYNNSKIKQKVNFLTFVKEYAVSGLHVQNIWKTYAELIF